MPCAFDFTDYRFCRRHGAYFRKIDIDANFSAGDSPRAAASVTEDGAKYKIAYECWREIEREDEYTTFTKRYWYSDAEMAAGLSEDEKFSTFEKERNTNTTFALKATRVMFLQKTLTFPALLTAYRSQMSLAKKKAQASLFFGQSSDTR